MAYAGRPAFPGGCFIAAASFEFDSRPGPVHDALAAYMRRWHTQLVADVTIAVEAGDLPKSTDVEQVAFGLEALAARGVSDPPTLRRRARCRAREGIDAQPARPADQAQVTATSPALPNGLSLSTRYSCPGPNLFVQVINSGDMALAPEISPSGAKKVTRNRQARSMILALLVHTTRRKDHQCSPSASAPSPACR